MGGSRGRFIGHGKFESSRQFRLVHARWSFGGTVQPSRSAIYQTYSGPRTDLLAQMRNPGSEVLEMHSMGISADGNRLAIGGIRAGSRRGVLDWSAIVHDVPLGGEIQVWNIAAGSKLTAFNSPTGEVFGVVALDRGGKRLAGVRGIQFASMLTGTLQRTPGRPPGPPVTPGFSARTVKSVGVGYCREVSAAEPGFGPRPSRAQRLLIADE
jgi:hypothetical protein